MSDLEQMLLEAFRAECREHLEGIRAVLVAVEAGERTPGADVDEAFRRAHSLKAAARICDLGTPGALGQRLEKLFSCVRQGSVPLDARTIDIARRATDALEDWASCWEAGQAEVEPIAVLEELDRLLVPAPVTSEPSHPTSTPIPAGGERASVDEDLLAAFQIEHREHLERLRALLADVEATGATLDLVDEAFRRIHTLKGAANVAGLPHAGAVAHRLESLFTQARVDPLRLTPATVRAVHRGLDFIEDAALCLLDGRPAPDPAGVLLTLTAPPSDDKVTGWQGDKVTEEIGKADVTLSPGHPVTLSSSPEGVRVSAEHLDQLLRSAEQLLTEGLGQDRVLRELGLIQREAEDLAQLWETARGGSGVLRRAEAMLELAGAADFLHRVEEQMRTLVRRVRSTRRLHRQGSSSLRLLGQQLQLDVRRARTVPAEGIFQGFRKMMRDLAQAEEKEIDFRMTGLEVQADRLVLQALKDPLMHALRNAVCHGIEHPAERLRQGKASAGQISLRLEVLGNRLKILVEDDGRGIDLKQVAAEAVRRGHLTEVEAVAAGPEELIQQVFRPAFSTARVVTELAGRGMGLSVVQEAVTRLQGEVQLTSRSPNSGTRVVISVPLSISAQRLLLVCCGGQTFAVPTHSVEKIYRVRPNEIETVAGQPSLLLSGEPVPLQSLAGLLGLAHEAMPDPLPVVVVRLGSRRTAVAVDVLLGEREALIKDLDTPAARPDRWAGAVLLEDGSVCLVLNPAGLAQSAPTGEAVPAPVRPRPAPEKRRTILVVDDSLTTRTLEKSILEAHGFRVRLALDGIEALAHLHEALPDLVITDVQMPRLDGFGLLEQMKSDARLSKVPVIVVSSMERREDQERGLALGADAYVVKRKFDHEELLQIIRQIL